MPPSNVNTEFSKLTFKIVTLELCLILVTNDFIRLYKSKMLLTLDYLLLITLKITFKIRDITAPNNQGRLK